MTTHTRTSTYTERILQEVNDERRRQVLELGYSHQHDREHGVSGLLELAADRTHRDTVANRADLIQAIALMVAAVEVLDEYRRLAGAHPVEAVPITSAAPPVPEPASFTFQMLRDTGMLWLINRSLLHPRGLALALNFPDGGGEPQGWSLLHAGTDEVWTFGPGVDEDELFKSVESLFSACRTFGTVPQPEAN